METEKARFETVLKDELDLLGELRGVGARVGPSVGNEAVFQRAHKAHLAGLAFSGGGIRSATFNLGVLLALAKSRLLNRFDYLSTVSGGGYIGGWFSALLQRLAAVNGIVNQAAVADFEPSLTTHPKHSGFKMPDENSGFKPVEHAAVRFLRRYSHYLIPRHGFSGDFLATVALFLRNLVLLQIGIVALLAAVFMTAHVVGLWSRPDLHELPKLLSWLRTIGNPLGWQWPFIGAAIAYVVSFFFAGRLLVAPPTQEGRPSQTTRKVFVRVVLPSTLAAWWLSMGMVAWPNLLTLADRGPTRAVSDWVRHLTHNALGDDAGEALLWGLLGAAAYLTTWILGYAVAVFSSSKEKVIASSWAACKRAPGLLFSAALSGAVLGLLLYGVTSFVAKHNRAIDVWHGVGFGPPLILLIFSFAVAVHIGIARNGFSEPDREWWARLGGLMLMVATLWALVFALVIYAPPLMRWLAGGGVAAVAAWAGGSGAGAWLARGLKPGTGGKWGWKGIAAMGAPWLFVIGLSVLVAFSTHLALLKMFEPRNVSPPAVFNALEPSKPTGAASAPQGFAALAAEERARLDTLTESTGGVTIVWIVTLLFFFVFTVRFDINLFSLHTLYRNRLDRAYLGATRAGKRKPHPFTGFDTADDLPFHQLGHQRPIHIINTTVNMTGGDDLSWQTRRGASFAVTPNWAGFEAKSSQGDNIGCYRPTRAYAGGLSLATLMAVSGAAASPNMGYHTSPAVAALLTAFNLRLGRWCGNPVYDEVLRRPSPSFSARPILSELSGSATARARWVNLTDGGHFDNLGIYELVRRRCHLIVASDAGCDPQHAFGDLANVIRKCWTDFGVHIHFEDLAPLRLDADSRCCKTRHIVGRIHYPDASEDGLIVYLKAALDGTETVDVREYADSHPAFPHESTGDQFFDENQFEGYRHLGFDIGAEVARTLNTVWEECAPAPGFNVWQSRIDLPSETDRVTV